MNAMREGSFATNRDQIGSDVAVDGSLAQGGPLVAADFAVKFAGRRYAACSGPRA